MQAPNAGLGCPQDGAGGLVVEPEAGSCGRGDCGALPGHRSRCGLPFEHGCRALASQTYQGCLLFYIGCTADAEVTAELFDDTLVMLITARTAPSQSWRRCSASAASSCGS